MPEHSKLKMVVFRQESDNKEIIARKQCDALLSISGIGSRGLRDVSENPDKYLYGIRKK